MSYKFVDSEGGVLFPCTRKSLCVLWILIDGTEHRGSTCRTASHRDAETQQPQQQLIFDYPAHGEGGVEISLPFGCLCTA